MVRYKNSKDLNMPNVYYLGIAVFFFLPYVVNTTAYNKARGANSIHKIYDCKLYSYICCCEVAIGTFCDRIMMAFSERKPARLLGVQNGTVGEVA